jgi:gamma-glutamylcyclotransferase (GGCT)/AIG2-like uncharacterized protein YtfP
MWRHQMKQRCPEHHLVGQGVLRGYRWIISSRGYANVIRSPSDHVYGLVYEISESDEETLDDKEGVNTGSYSKETLVVELNGSPTTCLVYVDPTKDEGKSKAEYVSRINKGILDAGLPVQYVEDYIRKHVPAGLNR